MSLTEKTASGVIWSLLGGVIGLVLNFGIGLILARILEPKEFGILGMITIFISISEMIVNSGFNQALIRKNDCTEIDYSTVFNFNVLISIFLYIFLFFGAPNISIFFNEALLTDIIRVIGLSLLINSVSLIQRVKLAKNLDFKTLNNIQNLSNLISGLIAVLMAFKGFGVWALVFKTVLRDLFNSIFFWSRNFWKPILVINKDSFYSLFGFGSKLLLSGIIGTIINNFQYIVIGKFFSAQELGFFTRAELFKNLPSQNIEGAISSVGYPALSKVQYEQEKLTNGFKKLLLSTVFLISFFMIGTIVIAEPLIISLVGEKWRNSIIYLQLLSFVGLMYPILTININLANVMGRSDLYLKGQLYSQIISVISIFIFAFWGIKMMIFGMIINSVISFVIFSNISSRFTNYELFKQIKDISTILIIAIISWLPSLFLKQLLSTNGLIEILLFSSISLFFLVIISEFLKQKEYLAIKFIIISKIR
jgi:teichuronic acid exporter